MKQLKSFFLVRFTFLTLLLFLSANSLALPRNVDTTYVFTDLREALNNPEIVYNLDLNGQKLSIIQLAKLSKFKNLVSLDLSCTWINSFPKSIFKCSNLKYLNIENNDIKKIPGEIGELSLLQELIVGYNEIDSLPQELFTLIHLKTLDLSGVWTLKSLPKELQNLKNLENLDCHTNSKEFNQIIAPITSLKELNIVSDEFISPCQLLKMNNLEIFRITLLHPAKFTIDQFDCSLISLSKLLKYRIAYYDYCCPWVKLQDEEIEKIKSWLPSSCEFSGYYKKVELRSDIELR